MAVEITSLKIKVDEDLTLDLSIDKARKLRDALNEMFPAPVALPSPIIIERPVYWPYRHWDPYCWSACDTSHDTEKIQYRSVTCSLE